MTQTCRQCSRVNPPEASYCYYDGTILGSVNGGPLNLGTQPFLSPFVFPSGRICRNFEQLALACQENWSVVLELLQQGYLESFLSSLGRIDLALAAREAARFPDRDRGLDQFLGQLPGNILQAPRLHVEPGEINLGLLPVGEDRRFEMVLENQGMRLLYGSATCVDCVWLALGDTPGVQQKLFQFNSEHALPVHVRGQYLRAGQKPQEGRVVIDSNGGKATVLVRLEVPVKPLAAGVLAGARSPRQVAEKAKAHPKEASVLMESGALARWYQENGWQYPVQGPPASGLGAVQQFFEALGLVTPPKVQVSELHIRLQCKPGDKIEHVLKVMTAEKRPVYAHATSDQPWLEVGRARLNGRVATIPLVVPTVPDQPGETLAAKLAVMGNGNQRFVVQVVLTIAGPLRTPQLLDSWGPAPERKSAFRSAFSAKAEPVVLEAVPAVVPVPVAGEAVPVLLEAVPARRHSPKPSRVLDALPVEPVAAGIERARTPGWVHLLPVAFLAVGLMVVMLRDIFKNGNPSPPEAVAAKYSFDPSPRIAVLFHDQELHGKVGVGGMKPGGGQDRDKGTPVIWEPSMRFGLVMLGEQDPHNLGLPKRLTFQERGLTNNTCVRLDGNEWLFGERPFRKEKDGTFLGSWPGRWKQQKIALEATPSGRKRQGCKSVWIYDDQRVLISQTVEIVPGEQSRPLDTCLVRYRIENQDQSPHTVGIRFLLDTYIGANDGVPFTIPGARQLCDTDMEFNGSKTIPDFIQALEHEDLAHPGTIAHLQLRLGGGVEAPDRVTLGAWPNVRLRARDPRCSQEKTLWEVPVLPIKSLPPGDSAVTIYWNERLLKPGEAREVGFGYGLGSVASGEGAGMLALTVGGSFTPGGEFTLTAYVRNPVPGQTVTLTLPRGFKLLDASEEQSVPPLPPGASSSNSPVTWKIRAASREGKFSLKVQSSTGVSQTQTVTIRSRRLFD